MTDAYLSKPVSEWSDDEVAGHTILGLDETQNRDRYMDLCAHPGMSWPDHARRWIAANAPPVIRAITAIKRELLDMADVAMADTSKPATTPERMQRWLYGPAGYDDFCEGDWEPHCEPPATEQPKPPLKRETVERFDPFRGFGVTKGAQTAPTPQPTGAGKPHWSEKTQWPILGGNGSLSLPRPWEVRNSKG
jgi:hypothetical protein